MEAVIYFDLSPIIAIVIFALIMVSYFLFHITIGRNNINGKNSLFFALFVVYLIVLIRVVFFPMIFTDVQTKGLLSQSLQLIPFKSIKEFVMAFKWGQILGNIALLFPIPIFVGLLREKFPRLSSTLFLGILVSLSIELIQLSITYFTHTLDRVTDIDDLILNIIGVVIGWYVIKRFITNKRVKVLGKEEKGKMSI